MGNGPSGEGLLEAAFSSFSRDTFRAGIIGNQNATFVKPSEQKLEELDLKALLLGLDLEAEQGAIEHLIRHFGLTGLSRASAEQINQESALSGSDSLRLACAFELGRQVEADRWCRGDSVRTAAGVYRLMAPKLRGIQKESFYVLLLDGRHRLHRCRRVSVGTLTTSLVHPREVFGEAIRENAAAIIVVHNHPSGDPEPSREDYEVTRRLAECGKMVGIPLLDHVVIGLGRHVSIRSRIDF